MHCLEGLVLPGALDVGDEVAVGTDERKQAENVLPPTVSWTMSAPSIPLQARTFAPTSSFR